MDRSRWKVSTATEAIFAVRAALKGIRSPHADVSLEVDLLEYIDDGVWLVVPGSALTLEGCGTAILVWLHIHVSLWRVW